MSDIQNKVFIDTNIWISGYLFSGNERRIIEHVLDDSFSAIISFQVLSEFRRILIDKFSFDETEVQSAVNEIMLMCELVKVDPRQSVDLADKDDIDLLKAALGAGCDFFLTGDKMILETRAIGSMRVIRTTELLGLLEGSASARSRSQASGAG